MVQYRDDAVSRVLGALADPSRREILDRLSRRPRSVGQLAEPLGVSLPAVLKQLAILEDARLVHTRKEGRVRVCELQPAGLDPAAAWINERHRLWTDRLDRLGDYLKGQDR